MARQLASKFDLSCVSDPSCVSALCELPSVQGLEGKAVGRKGCWGFGCGRATSESKVAVNGVPLKVHLMGEPWVVKKVVWPVAKTWQFGGSPKLGCSVCGIRGRDDAGCAAQGESAVRLQA